MKANDSRSQRLGRQPLLSLNFAEVTPEKLSDEGNWDFADTAMTAADIRSQRFGTQYLRGLSSAEVSAFLEDVAEAFEDLEKTNLALTSKVKLLEAKMKAIAAHSTNTTTSAPSNIEVLRTAALQEVEALLHEARAEAQALIDGGREREAAALREIEAANVQKRRDADDLVAEATSRAESLIAAAREEETAIRKEIDRLSQSRPQLIDDVRATLDIYHQWLGSVDPRGRGTGTERGA
jgi:DivIVA domain-containing protein